MSDRLSRNPANLPVKHVSPELGVQAKSWRYEQRGGILVVTELRNAEGKFLGTTQTLVRNGAIFAYLKRRGYPRLAANAKAGR